MIQKLKNTDHLILMGDVIDSTHKDQPKLASQLADLVAYINNKYIEETLSPLTITLGDEFQGISKSIKFGVNSILDLEEEGIKRGFDFKLHYVLLEGAIETKINHEIAHGMMGEGLTRARNILTEKKRSRNRFRFELRDEKLPGLENLFEVLDGIVSQWKLADFKLIYDMITISNDSVVGEKYNKDRSLIWRRRKTLMIKEYLLLKTFIQEYVSSYE